jgi:alpha-tubulin suppressor-like RCC1 family protein
VSAGYYHNCGLGMDALIYCWGANFDGQLGDGTTTDRLTPTVIRGGRSFRQVRAGPTNTCGVTTTNAAYCWGTNRYGQIGNGTSGYAARRVTPTAVLGGLQFTAVTPGGGHTCGVTTGDRAYCWGHNAFGQLGDGTTTKRLTPVAVSGGLNFKPGVSTGYSHTCGVTTGGEAYCWGFNASGGQLGDGTTTNRSTPVAVVGPM